jgi:hypothetical protein
VRPMGRKVSLDNVQIGSAERANQNANANLSRLWLRRRDFVQFKGRGIDRPGLFERHRLH